MRFRMPGMPARLRSLRQRPFDHRRRGRRPRPRVCSRPRTGWVARRGDRPQAGPCRATFQTPRRSFDVRGSPVIYAVLATSPCGGWPRPGDQRVNSRAKTDQKVSMVMPSDPSMSAIRRSQFDVQPASIEIRDPSSMEDPESDWSIRKINLVDLSAQSDHSTDQPAGQVVAVD
jgi:hypothetical protein